MCVVEACVGLHAAAHSSVYTGRPCGGVVTALVARGVSEAETEGTVCVNVSCCGPLVCRAAADSDVVVGSTRLSESQHWQRAAVQLQLCSWELTVCVCVKRSPMRM